MNLRNSFILYAFALLMITFAFQSCNSIEKPVFLRMENIKIDDVSFKNATLKANAVFHNPNPVAGHIELVESKIFANDIFISNVRLEDLVEVPPNSDFEVPIVLTVPFRDLVKKESSLLKSAMNMLQQKKVNVRYDGHVLIKFAKITIPVEMQDEQEVEIKF